VIARDVHVRYQVIGRRQRTLLHRIGSRGNQPDQSQIRALRGVNLTAYEGDAIAVIGPNGSGKSTLLAAIAGLLPINSGEVRVSEVPQLFGVGGRLLRDASGKRNIRLGALALGVTPDRMEDVSREIAEFSGLGEALDRPMRTYSSGMRARLHFSIATSVRPQVLLIDEGLAVGDRRFRRRAEARIADLLGGTGTLIQVSHNDRELKRMCNRAVWLSDGEIISEGGVAEILDQYEASEAGDD
jgi:teichoic acid transport system ATP-binding protein